MKNVIRILQGLLFLVWALLLAVNIRLYTDGSAAGGGLGGWAGFVVEDARMEPELSAGDLAVIRKGAGFQPGDMVLCREGDRMAVTRIVGTSGDQLILKADNAQEGELAGPEGIEGVCVAYIPGFGQAFRFLHSLPGLALIVAAGLLLFAVPALLLRTPAQEKGRARRGGYTARH